MNKSIIGIILAVVAVGAIAGVVVMNKPETAPNTTNTQTQHDDMNDAANNNQPSTTSPLTGVQETSSVTMIDTSNSYDFSPKQIKVKKGTTVKWTNESNTKHDVNPTPETADFKASELLKKGESYEVTFNTVGTFNYICSPHPFMKGSVEVVE